MTNKQLDPASIGKLPQILKVEKTPAISSSHYPNQPLEDSNMLASATHLHMKEVAYSPKSYRVSDQELAISLESPSTQERHWFSVKEDYTYEISQAINDSLLAEKADGYLLPRRAMRAMPRSTR